MVRYSYCHDLPMAKAKKLSAIKWSQTVELHAQGLSQCAIPESLRVMEPKSQVVDPQKCPLSLSWRNQLAVCQFCLYNFYCYYLFIFRICNKAYLQCCDFIAKVAFILHLPHSHQSPTEQLSLIFFFFFPISFHIAAFPKNNKENLENFL